MFCICCLVYCISYPGVYYISHQVYCRGDHTSGASLGRIACIAIKYTHLLQEPHLGVLLLPTGFLHLPSNMLQRPTCTSGASLRCAALSSRVLSILSDVHQEPHLGGLMCYHVLQEPHFDVPYCHQTYCISYHVGLLQEPHFGVLHLPHVQTTQESFSIH